MREGSGDYSNEDLERDVKDGKITAEEAENIRKLSQAMGNPRPPRRSKQSSEISTGSRSNYLSPNWAFILSVLPIDFFQAIDYKDN